MPYAAPVRDMRFVIDTVAGRDGLVERDLVAAILDEAAKFAAAELDPLNQPADRIGSVLENGVVRTPPGFREAYRGYVEAGWMGLQCDPEHGGQGLPMALATAVVEMWNSGCMSWALCPLLNFGAIELLQAHGSPEQKRLYLDKLVSGEWTGTMNLTEPQAGSDLAAVRTRAVPQGDGTYKLYGQKIFITYGEHDYTENIIHLVLARTPDAPEGVKGISLFVVPKFLVNTDGSLGARNDVYCVSLEHKLGIHASPTAVLVYGDHGGAVGYLVGEENRGLEYMFIMMNIARFAVGMEGVGLAERAYQRAAAYAKERVQGKPLGAGKAGEPIIGHPDIRRMLMTMRAQTEAMRAVAYVTSAAMDNANRHPDGQARKRHQAFVDFMIPIVKGWSTETGQEVASLGVQVHGGMGYIEETGAAQYLRDARITTIYEGTTGIQANDLIGRKTARDGGAQGRLIADEIDRVAAELDRHADPVLKSIGTRLAEASGAARGATDWIVAAMNSDPEAAHAVAVPYLRLWGLAAGGWQLGRAALIAARKRAASDGDPNFLQAKIATARFYAEALLPQVSALARAVTESGESALALAADQF